METKHTPGPWEAGKSYKNDANSHYAVVFAPAQTGRHHAPRSAEALGLSATECSANARLIAAAPDLLEALVKLRDLRDQWRNDDRFSSLDYMDAIDAMPWESVIAKATAP